MDSSVYEPKRESWKNGKPPEVAIVGSGPAGLSAAHYLSLKGCKVTIFEAEEKPGGMLSCVIPSYRLPREVIHKEIESIVDENITLKCNTPLGKNLTIDTLFEYGFKVVLLAMGAHKSKPLHLENEDIESVHPSIEFLKGFNLHGTRTAKGRVGVIGGGNAAIDAARVAVRNEECEEVFVIYRRTIKEMPAFEDAESFKEALREARIKGRRSGMGVRVDSRMAVMRKRIGK